MGKVRGVIRIVSMDFQKDFTAEGGACYRPRRSVGFVKETLVPFLRKRDVKIAEIVSDYRKPRYRQSRAGRGQDLCRPGEPGYQSELPDDVRHGSAWIKCMNSPVWTRKNIGIGGKKPGLPRQDPRAFGRWLEDTVGKPEDVDEVVLIGLTLDRCVLCTAQELYWRGYQVRILEEAVDSHSGSLQEKKQILYHPPLTNWAKAISWKTLSGRL